MLFEVISLLMDSSMGHPHVAAYMQQIAIDHRQCKVDDPVLYEDFMSSLGDVLAGLMSSDWTTEHAAAWIRQTKVLLNAVPGSMRQGSCPFQSEALQVRLPG